MESEFRMMKQGNELIIELEIPDLKRDEIKVYVEGDYVRIQGKREISNEVREEGYYVKRKESDDFLKQIGLPVNIESEKAKIEYLNRLIRITAPISG